MDTIEYKSKYESQYASFSIPLYTTFRHDYQVIYCLTYFYQGNESEIFFKY